MTQQISRYLTAAAVAAATVVAPLAASALTAPATWTAQCPPGQTGVIYGCAPFCVAGKYLDTQTGLCMPVAPPPPAAAPRY
ncbi:hypothetical protein JN086_02485 [Mycolicibacterium austroafricanum]|uniref:Uncharacterized protein n=1 Tax=Mycolicibacterium austroafricanum TaxID=39687 RepID=A0ABT8HER8_MYCAO|nr:MULTISPECIES: hypothetical protein [Mycolicibacterium]MDN4519251.1 hypothetical protein [Mycolicibacterium austroafricanum]QRZ07269.1 hypothetical protein JN090_01480 [Mycolicibacterium austroafricanum]QZT57360.1 hypothetical protein JN084_01680 [Mycolicibacterium austroafricanum]QZT68931.1 hypothetical protein JN086_02485 [Mycolicibacterium austroafricanum]UJL29701.1 hypothetical protein HZU38_04075 [Mycolicibacterium vanbaalenii]